VVLGQGALPRRQRPGSLPPGRAPVVDLRHGSVLGARHHRRPCPRPARSLPAAPCGLPALAGPGYEGAGIGIHISVKQSAGGRELDINTRIRNALQRSLRCLGERRFGPAHRPAASPPVRARSVTSCGQPCPDPFGARLHHINSLRSLQCHIAGRLGASHDRGPIHSSSITTGDGRYWTRQPSL
jgi:hypothetical protein